MWVPRGNDTISHVIILVMNNDTQRPLGLRVGSYEMDIATMLAAITCS